MTSRGALLLVVLTTACGEAGARIGTEPIGEAELRVVVARTSASQEAVALGRDAPYRFAAEPLDDVFARDDAVQVWVFGYRAETLATAFPSLDGRGVLDIVGRLNPGVGAPGPGRYAAPNPEVLLFTRLEADTGADVTYETPPVDQAAPAAQLFFELPGEEACPPVGAVLRAFDLDDPGRACIFTRNASCEWARTGEACPHQAQIFGGEGAIYEQPDGTLRVGEEACAPESVPSRPDVLGETAAFRCGDRLVSVQERPQSAEGPWAPARVGVLDDRDALPDGQWAAANPGAYFAFEDGGRIRVQRVRVAEADGDLEPLVHPVIDSDQFEPRLVRSDDGQTVALESGEFERNVGSAAQQCFRLLEDGDRPSAWATIADRPDTRTLRLLAPGVAPFPATNVWQVVGDPGQTFSSTREPAPVTFPLGTNGLAWMSARPGSMETVVVHGRGRTFSLPQVTRFPSDRHLFSCPEEIPRPANLVGPIAAGPSGLVALLTDGLQTLDDAGAVLATIDASVTFDGSEALVTAEGQRGQPRAIAYRNNVAHVFSLDLMRHDRVEVPGRIVGVLTGPDLLFLPTGEDFVLARARVRGGAITETVRYVVPAFEETRPGPLEVRPSATRDDLIGFSAGSLVGVLDLASGRSTATAVGAGAAVQAIFEDESRSETFGAITSELGDLELVRLPAPPDA